MTTTTTRTDLTAYEVEKLHAVSLIVKKFSLEVGAFVTRSGSERDKTIAANLYLELLEDLVSDNEVSTGAIRYDLFMASHGKLDENASQAYRLRCDFLEMLFNNVIAERVEA